MANVATTWTISVVVHRGATIDASKNRHVGLWCEPKDGSPNYYYHVCKGDKDFEFQERGGKEDPYYKAKGREWDATQTKRFLKKVYVGETLKSITQPTLTATLKAVPVNNSDAEFNCQTWVSEALDKLQKQGFISKDAESSGFDNMMEEITKDTEDHLVM